MKTFDEHKKIPKLDESTGLYRYPTDESKPGGYVEAKDIPPEFFPKIKIIVDSEQSKDQILKALEYLHYEDIDTDLMAVNSLVHHYLFPGSIEVNPDYDFNVGQQR